MFIKNGNDAAKADHEARYHQPGESGKPQQQDAEKGYKKRNQSGDDSCESAVDIFQGPGKQAVADTEKEYPLDRNGDPGFLIGPCIAPAAEIGYQQEAADKLPYAGDK